MQDEIHSGTDLRGNEQLCATRGELAHFWEFAIKIERKRDLYWAYEEWVCCLAWKYWTSLQIAHPLKWQKDQRKRGEFAKS
jgi:hypothetical protein